MNVRRFEDAREFYPHVMPFLVQNEAVNNVLLGVSASLMRGDGRVHEAPYMATCERDGDILAVALRTPPYNLMISPVSDPAVIAALAADAHDCYGTLPGLIAARPTAERFAECWQLLTGQETRLDIAEGLYRLEQVKAPRPTSGECCPATDANFDLLVAWFQAFVDEALPGAPEDAEGNVRSRMNADPRVRGLRLWIDGGKPVSMAGYGSPTPNGIRVAPVYTPPEYRGRGYASALTAALSQELLDQGRSFVFLFTDLSNPTSNHIYQQVGYEQVCDVDMYKFG